MGCVYGRRVCQFAALLIIRLTGCFQAYCFPIQLKLQRIQITVVVLQVPVFLVVRFTVSSSFTVFQFTGVVAYPTYRSCTARFQFA